MLCTAACTHQKLCAALPLLEIAWVYKKVNRCIAQCAWLQEVFWWDPESEKCLTARPAAIFRTHCRVARRACWNWHALQVQYLFLWAKRWYLASFLITSEQLLATVSSDLDLERSLKNRWPGRLLGSQGSYGAQVRSGEVAIQAVAHHQTPTWDLNPGDRRHCTSLWASMRTQLKVRQWVHALRAGFWCKYPTKHPDLLGAIQSTSCMWRQCIQVSSGFSGSWCRALVSWHIPRPLAAYLPSQLWCWHVGATALSGLGPSMETLVVC